MSQVSIGIVGLPNVGKSTLFKALTKKEVEIANYPFATIDPNVGIVEVPDERLYKLADFSRSEKVVPTVIEFVDIAGLVRGANKGEGLGNQFLANIREVDAVLYVTRAFEDENIQHVEKRVDPKGDMEILQTELALKDLETVEKRLLKTTKEARGNDKNAMAEEVILEKLKNGLSNGTMSLNIFEKIDTDEAHPHIERLRRELQLLTSKPGILLLNTNTKAGPGSTLTLSDFGFPTLTMNANEELESSGFSIEERKDLSLGDSKLHELIQIAYKTLGLITFFTTGEDEARAWTVRGGALAPEAAGAIHTDFEDQFIRADIIQWDALLSCAGWQDAKTKGIMKTVGKDYDMQDGDVMDVKHGA